MIRDSAHLSALLRAAAFCSGLLLLAALSGCTSARDPLRNGCLIDALRAKHDLAQAGYRAQIITTQYRGTGHAITVWPMNGLAWGYDASQGTRCISRHASILREPLPSARAYLSPDLRWAVFFP